MKDTKPLCDLIRQTAYDIHLFLGHGHLEKVYENALFHRLRKHGVEIEQQAPIQVFDEDDALTGDYIADLLVEKALWAIHLTGVVFIQSPWAIGGRAIQCRGMPTFFRWSWGNRFGMWVRDQILVTDRLMTDGQFQQSIEQHSSTS